MFEIKSDFGWSDFVALIEKLLAKIFAFVAKEEKWEEETTTPAA